MYMMGGYEVHYEFAESPGRFKSTYGSSWTTANYEKQILHCLG